MGLGDVPVGYSGCYRLSTHCRITYSPFYSTDNVTIFLFMYTLISLSLFYLVFILSTIFLCKLLAIKLIIIKDQIQLNIRSSASMCICQRDPLQ